MHLNIGLGRPLGSTWTWVLVAASLGLAPAASARRGGIVVESCQGCHDNGLPQAELEMTAESDVIEPGDTVNFELTIRGDGASAGGTFITTADGIGTLEALPGEGLAFRERGLAHTTPKAAVNGAVTFRFAWRAPTEPGGVDFRVVGLAANGNGQASGDAPGSNEFQWAYGCEGRLFYLDLDRDGYGRQSLGTRIGCAGDPPPSGYAAEDGDCDENNEMVNPGATEVCNRRDDDCNGEIDENAPELMMWPDNDGDGYYASENGEPTIGCGDMPGFASEKGDCNDSDPDVNPGATEVCNNLDDNCDGEVDERARPQCGVGWCSRYSPTCDPADCEPGPPSVETCNSLDDDCDGIADNNVCSDGTICSGADCVALDDANIAGSGGLPPSGGTGGLPSTPGSAGGPSIAGSPAIAGAAPTTAGAVGEPSEPETTEEGCSVASGLGRPEMNRGGWFAFIATALGLGVRRRRRGAQRYSARYSQRSGRRSMIFPSAGP